ncbi:FecR domain-containing protein [Reichenbachiella agarivorans]|uniref:FecR domain-containing protein n=1 Tax=Reichenbachiella agarivorans TaxID=2979464 RepID=A0ABY6CLH2_9BACT|nr:FecR family protein [Reichenbachiella agarivorans]UXP31371.1 FecR domain-containing protein [Reichenbachiella agarivorans]
MMESMQNIELKIQQYLSGELSQEEKAEVLDWANSSEANQAMLDKYSKLYDLSVVDCDSFHPDVDKAWCLVQSKLVPKAKQFFLFSPTVYKIAAAVVMAVGLAFFSVSYFLQPNLIALKTGEGEVIQVVLPDGTEVIVNEKSSFKYPEEFGEGSRKVYLYGQAFFNVARDEAHSFKIIGLSTVTEVLGTSFDLIAKRTYNHINVVSGQVSFKSKETNKKVVLSMDERAVYTESKMEVFQGLDNSTLAWRLGELNFQSAPLAQVAAVLEKHYNVKIRLEGNIGACLITSKFQGKTIEEVLSILKLIANIESSQEGNLLILSGPSC